MSFLHIRPQVALLGGQSALKSALTSIFQAKTPQFGRTNTLCYGWRVGIVQTHAIVNASAVNAAATHILTLPYLKLVIQYLNIYYYLRLGQKLLPTGP